jgi:hypothetical protein
MSGICGGLQLLGMAVWILLLDWLWCCVVKQELRGMVADIEMLRQYYIYDWHMIIAF